MAAAEFGMRWSRGYREGSLVGRCVLQDEVERLQMRILGRWWVCGELEALRLWFSVAERYDAVILNVPKRAKCTGVGVSSRKSAVSQFPLLKRCAAQASAEDRSRLRPWVVCTSDHSKKKERGVSVLFLPSLHNSR